MDKETIYNDYLKINEYPTLDEKKILAERYSIVSKKAKEIERAILIAAREERKTRNTFDENDLRLFSNLEIPERYRFEMGQRARDYILQKKNPKSQTKKIVDLLANL